MKVAIPPRAQKLLGFIAMCEGTGANYRAYYAHGTSTTPLPATLAGVLQFQNDLVKVRHMASSALGRYQFMPTTLRGLMALMRLGGDTPFTDDLQDALAFQLLRERGFDAWSAGGESDETFADSLSKEWASLPYHTGRSYYAGDGLNASRIARHTFLATLAEAKKLPAVPPLNPVTVASAPSPATTPSGQPSAPVSVLSPTAKVSKPMNPISMLTMAISLARDVAPMIPEVVGDVKVFVGDCEKLVGDLAKKDMSVTMTDIQKLFDDVKTDIPTILKAVKASKALAVA